LSERNFAIVDKLIAFAEPRGYTQLELAMSWLASKPYISSVIAGATSAAQVEQNAVAIAWRLTEAEMTTVNELSAR